MVEMTTTFGILNTYRMCDAVSTANKIMSTYARREQQDKPGWPTRGGTVQGSMKPIKWAPSVSPLPVGLLFAIKIDRRGLISYCYPESRNSGDEPDDVLIASDGLPSTGWHRIPSSLRSDQINLAEKKLLCCRKTGGFIVSLFPDLFRALLISSFDYSADEPPSMLDF
ncbi:hypothetical protein L249_0771 [Ophiocordyceps polyrhachis-furcata BCC 54312]|uniref:Uncharacterized protein n=1 Tax=Ophiocordyceps polyrhachis-furcata BCC 54312 TaxID=1330021 RepID=A0A367LD64_9HYPO|nr:hypothetical protein L249_0771 [Ophiocordyceps polyrhachis-furcata BCC 54312]